MPFQRASIFKGVFACDQLPKHVNLPAAFVINLSPSNEKGTHWVGLYINKSGEANYFDSYGFFPLTNKHIGYFIRMHSKKMNYNHKQIQHLSSTNCGKYVAIFILSQIYNRNFDEIIEKFSNNLKINDLVLENLFNYFKNIAAVKKTYE